MSGFKVEFSVLNLKATPGIYADAFANRPAAGYPGRVFIDTDNPSTGMYRDTGTVWVQIAETATSDVDTLQNVTDNGNTTTNSITVGAATTPAGTIDVRRATAALNNATDYGIVAISSPTIPNGAIFGVNNVNAIAGSEVLTFAGSATIGNNGLNSAGIFTNVLTSTGAGTVTVGQGSTLRSISGLQSVVYYNTAAATTFTHVAAIKTTQPINSGVAAASVTNNYGIIVADNTANSGTITYTNRWGIYQEGASDKNYFAANVLIKSTTDNGNALQVTGDGYISGNLGLGVTPSPWSLGKALDIANGPAILGFNNGSFLTNNAYYNGGWIYKATSAASNLVLNNDGSFQFNIAPSGTGGNAISFTQAMTLDASGKLGIGTSNPSYQLDLARAGGLGIRVQNTFNTDDAYLLAQTTLGSALFGINATGQYLYNGTAIPILFYTNGSERMRITSGGNVGIGTSSPAEILELTTATDPKIRFVDVGNLDAKVGIFGSTALGFEVNGSERMRITSGGELLINTTTDVGDFKLQVSGNAYVSGTIGINSTSPNAASLLQIDSTTKGFLLPRMTDAQITAISNPPDGLMVYSTDQNHIAFWNAAAAVWKKVSNSNL